MSLSTVRLVSTSWHDGFQSRGIRRRTVRFRSWGWGLLLQNDISRRACTEFLIQAYYSLWRCPSPRLVLPRSATSASALSLFFAFFFSFLSLFFFTLPSSFSFLFLSHSNSRGASPPASVSFAPSGFSLPLFLSQNRGSPPTFRQRNKEKKRLAELRLRMAWHGMAWQGNARHGG